MQNLVFSNQDVSWKKERGVNKNKYFYLKLIPPTITKLVMVLYLQRIQS